MKIEYTGLAPVENIYGPWTKGTVRIVPSDCGLDRQVGFRRVDIGPSNFAKKTKWKRRQRHEKLQDKLERENLETRE